MSGLLSITQLCSIEWFTMLILVNKRDKFFRHVRHVRAHNLWNVNHSIRSLIRAEREIDSHSVELQHIHVMLVSFRTRSKRIFATLLSSFACVDVVNNRNRLGQPKRIVKLDRCLRMLLRNCVNFSHENGNRAKNPCCIKNPFCSSLRLNSPSGRTTHELNNSVVQETPEKKTDFLTTYNSADNKFQRNVAKAENNAPCKCIMCTLRNLHRGCSFGLIREDAYWIASIHRFNTNMPYE